MARLLLDVLTRESLGMTASTIVLQLWRHDKTYCAFLRIYLLRISSHLVRIYVAFTSHLFRVYIAFTRTPREPLENPERTYNEPLQNPDDRVRTIIIPGVRNPIKGYVTG